MEKKAGTTWKTMTGWFITVFNQRESIIKVGVCLVSAFVCFLCSSTLSSFLFFISKNVNFAK